MKKILLISALLIVQSILVAQPVSLEGAWQSGPDENRSVMIVAGKFYSVALYNLKDKTYTGTYGGSWRQENNQFIEVQEFNTLKPELIGVEQKSALKYQKDKISLGGNDFIRIDDGTPGALAGAWLITGRMGDDGKISRRTPGARKTMKILSGTRFQWIAYNNETKEFFGTGGGTYTTVNGKYTESIEVFSRDNSRVGAKLEFDFSFIEENWRHSGKSSKGDPIDEIWTLRQKLGI